MSNEKIREQFEAWVKANWPNQSLERFNPLHGVTEGEYTGFTVQHSWDAWQASRAAIEAPVFSNKEIDLFRQWFNAMQDCCPTYVEQRDRDLNKKVKELLK